MQGRIALQRRTMGCGQPISRSHIQTPNRLMVSRPSWNSSYGIESHFCSPAPPKAPPSNNKPNFNKDRPAFNKDKPTFNKDKPTFNKDKPTFNKDRPPFNKDRPPFNKDKPPFNKDRPPFNKDKQPFNKDRPPFNKDRTPFDKNKNDRAGPRDFRARPTFERGSESNLGHREEAQAQSNIRDYQLKNMKGAQAPIFRGQNKDNTKYKSNKNYDNNDDDEGGKQTGHNPDIKMQIGLLKSATNRRNEFVVESPQASQQNTSGGAGAGAGAGARSSSLGSRGRGAGLSLSREGIFGEQKTKPSASQKEEILGSTLLRDMSNRHTQPEESKPDESEGKGQDWDEMIASNDRYTESPSPSETEYAEESAVGDPIDAAIIGIEQECIEMHEYIMPGEQRFNAKRIKMLRQKSKYRMQARRKRIERLKARGYEYPKPPPVKGQLPPQLAGGFGTYFPEILKLVPDDHKYKGQLYEAARVLWKNSSWDYGHKKIILKWIAHFLVKWPESKHYKESEEYLEKYPEYLMYKPSRYLQFLEENKDEFDKVLQEEKSFPFEFLDESGEIVVNEHLLKENKAKWPGYPSPPDQLLARNNPLVPRREKQ